MPMRSDAAPALFLFCLAVGTLLFFTSGVVATQVTAPPDTASEAFAPTPELEDAYRSNVETPDRLGTTAQYNESTGISVNTTIVISLDTEGNARWTITESFNTTTASQQRAFEDVAAGFEASEVSGYELGFDAFLEASQRVDAVTAREMRLTDSQRQSTLDGDTGRLSLSFTWENFARVQNGDVVLDDVYQTDQGLWFQGLGANQNLTIQSPDGYGFAEFTVSDSTSLEDRQLKIEGPVTFSNETLQAVLVGNSGSPDGTADDSTSPDPTPGDDGGSAAVGPMGFVLGGVGLLAVVVVVSVFAVGRERLATLIQKPSQTVDEETAVEPVEPTETAAEPEDPADTDESEIDTELLSDEERVERLLEQNGGRMKQANIVKETGWSNAKVSQLLSSMEDNDRIDKLRIGRENLISFPEEDVTEISDE
jgi:hypothetical protein